MKLKNVLLTIVAACFAGLIGYYNQFDFVKADSGVPRVNGGQSGLPAMDVVDVSSYNGNISTNDFQIMKNNGVKGVIVKLTEGTDYRNSYAASQIANAKSVGLVVSAYHYSTYTDKNSAQAEANYFLDYANQLGFSTDDLMINDLEDDSTKSGDVTANSIAFNNQLKSRGYNNTALYTNPNYKNTAQLDMSFIDNSHVWMASYPYNPSSNNLWNTQYGMWQWSSNAGFWGVNGTFDVSVDYAGIATTAKNVQTQIDGKWYLINQVTGQKQYGRQYIASQNKWVLYDRTTGAMLYGQQYDQGNWYYFDSNTGAMQYGLQNVNGSLRLYDSQTGIQFSAGQQYVNGKWYYINSDGSVQTGWQTLPQGKVYYGSDGTMQYGQQYVGGKWYLFDSNTGAMQIGRQYLGNQNKWVLYDRSAGNMLYGQQYDQGNWYYFDSNTGAMQYGQQYINGNWYLFDNTTGVMQTGRQFIGTQNKWVLYDRQKGQMLYGQQYDQGNWYLFDSNTGAMQYGRQYISNQNKWVLYDRASGVMLYGQQYDQGNWYLFDSNTGAMQYGRQYISNQNKWVLYDRTSGVMLYGQQYDQGDWYSFDLITGAMR